MTKYYKGNLFLLKDISKTNFTIDFIKCIVNTSDNEFLEAFKSLTEEDKTVLDHYFQNNCPKEDVKAYEILKKMFKNYQFHYAKKQEVLFEVIEDKDHNLYGVELITGKVFPIYRKKIDVAITKRDNKNFYVPKVNKRYALKTINQYGIYGAGNQEYGWIVHNQDDEFYVILDNPNVHLREVNNHKEQKDLKNVDVINENGRSFNLELSQEYLFTNLEVGESFIDAEKIATDEEVSHYLEKYRKRFFNFKYRRFNNTINDWDMMNCYKRKISKEDDIQEQSKVHLQKLIGKISYMLYELQKNDPQAFSIYGRRYREIQKLDNILLYDKLEQELMEFEDELLQKFYFSNESNLNINELLKVYIERFTEYDITFEYLNYLMKLINSPLNKLDRESIKAFYQNIAHLYALYLVQHYQEMSEKDVIPYLNQIICDIITHLNLMIIRHEIDSDVLYMEVHDVNMQSILNFLKENVKNVKVKELVLE